MPKRTKDARSNNLSVTTACLLFVTSLAGPTIVCRANESDDVAGQTRFVVVDVLAEAAETTLDTATGCADDSVCFDGGHAFFGPCDVRGRHRACYDRDKRRSLADKHAPVNLMGDHVHHRGEWMFEYRYMNMYMGGNKIGTRSVSDDMAFNVPVNGLATNKQAIPTEMTMEMHMLHIMYGLTDNITLYAMPMWTVLTMDHRRQDPFNPPNGPMPDLNGTPFTTQNDGFDDLVFGALYRVYEGCSDELILNFGCSVPTGDIDRQTSVPFGVPVDLPYPMRIGSGTFDARPGVTYKSYFDHGSLGIQYQADLSIGTNDQGYALGDEHRLNVWYNWLVCDRLNFSFRVENRWLNNIDGADVDQNAMSMMFISTNRSDSRGGFWTNFGYGVAMLLGDGYLLNFEAVHPVYEDLEGIQLSNNWWFATGISKGF